MSKLDERRGCTTSFLLCALEHAVFVAKTERADTAEIIHSQQIIQRVEQLRLFFFSFTAQLLSAFDVIAHDDTPCPTVRLGVGNRRMEDRTVFRLAMKLRPHLERKRGPQSEMRGFAEPARTVLESGTFASPLQVVAQRTDLQSVPAERRWSAS